ncbi:MAG: hypothetical protein JXN62_09350 [Bacteroidales bacterium]|nr:hypothetical protein [Bacteroidales bacterium]
MYLYIINKFKYNEKAVFSAFFALEKGFYPVRLEYFQKEENHNLQFYYLIPGGNDPIPVPNGRLYHRK